MVEVRIILTVLIGLVIFLFGIENFSSEIQRAAGDKFKKILKGAVSNKYRATFFGAFTTAILNSSTATTLIAIGLINAGLISFTQSLGIIFGANIGSTITAQLVALKLTAFAPYLMILGFIMSFIKKTKFIGKSFFFFGMVFFGLTLISDAVAPLAKDPEVIQYFLMLSSIPLAILAGFIFTIIFNSSALTMGLAIVLASSGLITLPQGIPLLLGANLGTTITTLIASSRMNLYAKRTAVAHLMFNVIGVILMLPFIGIYANFISSLGGSVEQQIANAHTIFNVLAAIVFLILLNPFRRVVESLVRGKEEEILLMPKYLEKETPKSNKETFELIEKEIKYFSEINFKMFSLNQKTQEEMKNQDSNKLLKMGVLTDVLSESIGNSLYRISQGKLTELEAKKVLLLVRISNSLEQLGDLAEELGNLPNKIKLKGRSFYLGKSTEKLEKIGGLLKNAFKKMSVYFPDKSSNSILNSISSKKIEKFIRESYASHVKILKKESYYSGSLFVEKLSVMENSLLKLKELLKLQEQYYLLKNNNSKHLNNNKN
jgi:phosphate:Na+ symporter